MTYGGPEELLKLEVRVGEDEPGQLELLWDELRQADFPGVDLRSVTGPSDVKGTPEIVLAVWVAVQISSHVLPHLANLIENWSRRPKSPTLTIRRKTGEVDTLEFVGTSLNGSEFAEAIVAASRHVSREADD